MQRFLLVSVPPIVQVAGLFERTGGVRLKTDDVILNLSLLSLALDFGLFDEHARSLNLQMFQSVRQGRCRWVPDKCGRQSPLRSAARSSRNHISSALDMRWSSALCGPQSPEASAKRTELTPHSSL